jgi:drug/metabolite transporter (DMT)-like permease
VGIAAGGDPADDAPVAVALRALRCVGIAPLTISNALWDRASRTEHTSLISVIAYATPLASIVIMTLFGVGAVSWPVLVGAVLVVAGALAASGLVVRGT